MGRDLSKWKQTGFDLAVANFLSIVGEKPEQKTTVYTDVLRRSQKIADWFQTDKKAHKEFMTQLPVHRALSIVDKSYFARLPSFSSASEEVFDIEVRHYHPRIRYNRKSVKRLMISNDQSAEWNVLLASYTFCFSYLRRYYMEEVRGATNLSQSQKRVFKERLQELRSSSSFPLIQNLMDGVLFDRMIKLTDILMGPERYSYKAILDILTYKVYNEHVAQMITFIYSDFYNCVQGDKKMTEKTTQTKQVPEDSTIFFPMIKMSETRVDVLLPGMSQGDVKISASRDKESNEYFLNIETVRELEFIQNGEHSQAKNIDILITPSQYILINRAKITLLNGLLSIVFQDDIVKDVVELSID